MIQFDQIFFACSDDIVIVRSFFRQGRSFEERRGPRDGRGVTHAPGTTSGGGWWSLCPRYRGEDEPYPRENRLRPPAAVTFR